MTYAIVQLPLLTGGNSAYEQRDKDQNPCLPRRDIPRMVPLSSDIR